MPLHRRDLLKSLLISPLFPFTKSLGALAGSPPARSATTGFINILLHGMFFMQLDNSDQANPLIVISAPMLTNHVFLAGTRRNLQLTNGFDWSKGYGLMGSTPVFPPKDSTIPIQVKKSILQFGKDETGVGPLKGDSGLYAGTVTLPWPYDFYSVRLGTFPSFDMTHTHVAPRIQARCAGSQIGVVTVLQYQYNFPGPVLPSINPVMNFHLHLLFCGPGQEDMGHVNQAFTDAGKIFTNSNFDLQITSSPLAVQPEKTPGVVGVTPEDENSAGEDEPDISAWCPPPKRAAMRKQLKQTPSRERDSDDGETTFNVNPANCPSFYVG